jgi:hypothetical protein
MMLTLVEDETEKTDAQLSGIAMTKPKSYRMKMHEINRAPDCMQAYPADKMDDWLDYLDVTINGYKFSQQGDAKLIDALKAENARLREALKDANHYHHDDEDRVVEAILGTL